MTNNQQDFEDIRPYTDEEAVQALSRVSRHPMLPIISKYLFPSMPATTMGRMLRSIGGVDQFQTDVMFAVIEAILERTSDGFTFSGAENLASLEGKCFLAISNHRDIVLDPAMIQYTMAQCGLPFTEICVGSNLLTSQFIEDLMRSNRMIKVIRGISSRELYLSSRRLSQYIRDSITENRSSVWIAQREGRTKDGKDTTEQGLLKMFDMSGKGDFDANFRELSIVPMSISYEYESCDARKAREVFLRRGGEPYVKKRNEDLHSILTGIRQRKGHIHLEIGKPISAEEIACAASQDRNERYQSLRQCLDSRIVSGYRLWPNNYIAHDLRSGSRRFADRYSERQKEEFIDYMNHKLGKLERRLDRGEIKKIFLGIYANPVDSALAMDAEGAA